MSEEPKDERKCTFSLMKESVMYFLTRNASETSL